MVEPSFNAMKIAFLLSLFVLTQPFTTTDWFSGAVCKMSLICNGPILFNSIFKCQPGNARFFTNEAQNYKFSLENLL